MITPADLTLLRRAIAIAAHAITLGDAPYGSLPADADGAILIEAHNTVPGVKREQRSSCGGAGGRSTATVAAVRWVPRQRGE